MMLFPGKRVSPLRAILFRIGIALALIVFVALVAYADRGGYQDNGGGGLSLLDAFYYSSVSVTTTGYGDVYPVSESARWITTLLVTPARIIFLVILVGTTLELLVSRSRERIRMEHFKEKLTGHVVICGYGVKGQAAAAGMQAQGYSPDQLIVVDPREEAARRATDDGLVAVTGDATDERVLHEARTETADSIVVATASDDTAVLVTLTARGMNAKAKLIAACRDHQNVKPLKRSGADVVVVSSGTAGRLLGLASESPHVANVIEDLLAAGSGLDIEERPVTEEEVASGQPNGISLGIVRNGVLNRWPVCNEMGVQAGDRVVILKDASPSEPISRAPGASRR